MNILQISPCYVDIYSETGGVANIIRQICLHLERKKINTVLICTNTELGKTVSKPDIIYYSDFLTIHIIKQHNNPLLGPSKKLKLLLNSIGNISLAHIHTCFSAITEVTLKHLTSKNIPCVFTPHGKLSPAMLGNKKLLKKIYFNFFVKKYINQSSEVITSSRNEVEYVKALGIKNKASFIYNGYTPPNQVSQKSTLKYDLQPKSYILFLGYIDSRKQPDLLVRAFKKSRASEKFKLVIAGPDSYGIKESLENLVASLDLEIDKKVIFTGRVKGQEKWKLLKNAKGLFLPSKGEGWPVVIAEAIGAEIPCIISKGCNFSEIEKMKLGVEVKSNKVDEWAKAIDDICFNSQLNNEFEKSLSRYKDYFSWSAITEKWLKSYKKIINETATR